MRQEERTAVILAQRELRVVEHLAVENGTVAGPALVVDPGIDVVGRRRGGQHVNDQRLVPPLHGQVHRPALVGAPVPVEGLFGPLLGEEVPLDGLPQPRNALAQGGLLSRPVEVGAGGQQPLEEVGRLDQIGSVVIGREGDRHTRLAVDPVGEGAVIGGRTLRKEGNDLLDTAAGLLPRDEAAFGRHDHRENPEAGAARGDGRARRGALARHAARGLGTLPEVAEGLLLDQRQELLIGDPFELVAIIGRRHNRDHLAAEDLHAGRRRQPRVDHQLILRPGGQGRRRREGHAQTAVVADPGLDPVTGAAQVDVCIQRCGIEFGREVELDDRIGRHLVKTVQTALVADHDPLQLQGLPCCRIGRVGRIAAASEAPKQQPTKHHLQISVRLHRLESLFRRIIFQPCCRGPSSPRPKGPCRRGRHRRRLPCRSPPTRSSRP